MTRPHFLKEIWTSYPDMPRSQEGIFCGRVLFIDQQKVILQNNFKEITLPLNEEIQFQDLELGESIPSQLLHPGDSVLYSQAKKCFFLMSPCLKKSDQLFSHRSQKWSDFLDQVKKYFKINQFVEIHTPFLVDSPGVDHHIEFFKVEGSYTKQTWFLPTSPELSLKKHLCQGYDKIFEIKKCFRDDLLSPIHRPEFTMLEWYRSFETLDKIKDDFKGLFSILSREKFNFENHSIASCFKNFINFELTPMTNELELKELSKSLEIEIHPTDDWNDLYFRLFIEKIEPQLKKIKNPIFLTDFPLQQASLAKINKTGWAERFELYWQGIELANAYLEVNDPLENKNRFEIEKKKRQKDHLPLSNYDENFFEELFSGMPPASGVAMGLDRLFMVLNKGESI